MPFIIIDLQGKQTQYNDRKEDDDAAEHNKYSVFTIFAIAIE